MTTLMWEAVAADVDALVAWASSYQAVGMHGRETYVSAEGRVVLITHWRDEAHADAADLTPPPGTTSRDPHVWRFGRGGVLPFPAGPAVSAALAPVLMVGLAPST